MPASALLVGVIIIPLVGAVLTPVVGGRSGRAAGPWALAVMLVTSAIALMLIVHVANVGPFSAYLGGWEPPYGIELRFDEFSASTSVICLLGTLSILFSFKYAEKELPPERIRYYYTLLLLNLTGMIGFVVTGDIFNLFVFMEILSLSGYALVAVSGERTAEMAAFKYLIMGAVSSLMVLFAIGLLYALTGSLNMADISVRLAGAEKAPAMLAIAAFTVGFMVKAALFPLHIWLPDAHAIAPSPVSAILSGLVVKTGLLGMIRIYQIYYGAKVLDLSALNTVLVWLGAISIVMGAFFAIFQEDIKMMLAYSTISNVGYIIMGLGLASQYGVIGAAVHIFNHALIKATLFLGAGAIIYRTGYRNLTDLRGIGRSMPLTTAAISIGAISIVGMPPTAGFLCKWYIALGAVEAGQPLFAVALVFGALFIFVYYIRMVNTFYFQEPVHPEILEVEEAPLSMLFPVLILAALCLIMGILGRIPLSFVEPAVTRLLAPLGG
ncbi:MAG: multicomponent Na+H+ antiporter subunit [Actinobacteria bacterium]|nr:MAG: multicomponent Na+H+ antiporter subunit [Actinomycetota bacterium]MDO8949218.1 monovalent cation/H+ antiporter subunit D family protein [Actinomycetota bacterium]